MPDTNMKGWIGVDLDGTLAIYDGWKGLHHIGEPIKPMCDLVRGWIEEGHRVKIMTARVTHTGFDEDRNKREIQDVIATIDEFCIQEFGTTLEVTNVKDFFMTVLYDDRAVGVVPNKGILVQ